MAKKRGLAANRGLDALLGSIKKEKQITASALQDDMVARENAAPDINVPVDTVSTIVQIRTQPKIRLALSRSMSHVCKQVSTSLVVI